MDPLEKLNDLGIRFEAWLRGAVPEGPNSAQALAVKPMFDRLVAEGRAIGNQLESRSVTPTQAAALVDAFVLKVERAKSEILGALKRSRGGGGGPSFALIAGLGAAAILLFMFGRSSRR